MLKEIAENVKDVASGTHSLWEYGLILALVAIVVIVVLSLLGPAIGNVFSNIVATL